MQYREGGQTGGGNDSHGLSRGVSAFGGEEVLGRVVVESGGQQLLESTASNWMQNSPIELSDA